MPASLTDPRIEIFLISRRLRLFSGHQFIKEYPVAIGKPNTPTPVGSFEISNKIMYPGGVFGTRWMEFKPAYGIHGTNNPSSIGTMASKGCVRMFNHDVEELFSKVRIGTPVVIMHSAAPEHFSPSTPYPEPANSSAPGPATNPSSPGTAGSTKRTHIVQPGDTLYLIAQHYGVTVNQILAVNNISNPNRINVGQVILIPSGFSSTAVILA
jgi:LysM repeat protein